MLFHMRKRLVYASAIGKAEAIVEKGETRSSACSLHVTFSIVSLSKVPSSHGFVLACVIIPSEASRSLPLAPEVAVIARSGGGGGDLYRAKPRVLKR